MGVEGIYELNFNNNQFTNVDFLKGIKVVKNDLKLNNNYISDLNGLLDKSIRPPTFSISKKPFKSEI